MRKLRDVLRLTYEAKLQQRAIAQACGLGLGTVNGYVHRAAAAGRASGRDERDGEENRETH